MVNLVKAHCGDASLAKFSADAMNAEWDIESPIHCEVINDGLVIKVDNPISAGLIVLGKVMISAFSRRVVSIREGDDFGSIIHPR